MIVDAWQSDGKDYRRLGLVVPTLLGKANWERMTSSVVLLKA